jgi:RNA polymerase sigma-70 factor (ECF subfamily)
MCSDKDSLETDASLVRRLQDGDLAAFDVLFERHRRGVIAYVTGMIHDAAASEDIVQEVFVKLVRRIADIDPERGVSAWLYRVARNGTIDRLRKYKREILPGDVELGLLCEDGSVGVDVTPAERMVRDESSEAVQKALAGLPPKERDLLLLRYYGDCSFKEIASIVRRPLGTVLWQVHRSLAKMRKDFVEKGSIAQGGEFRT